MAPVNRLAPAECAGDERGFSLIEVLASILILTAGLLPLAALFATAVQRIGASTPMMIARERAREAIESVHSARDTGGATWANIRNVADGGLFLGGPQPIKDPGDDGLVNTADDGVEELPEALFTRQITISPLNVDCTGNVNPNLRQVTVTVRYRVGNTWTDYVVVTYISSYS
ncbi:MAG: prepilin-type N-terminal cleavage/methylation domain-containing protein [Cyanobacteria bacterium]|nr:prepilin-type N-terminal cleavage/methylation domain-containing protein [Cyanobacteriota bacterium]